MVVQPGRHKVQAVIVVVIQPDAASFRETMKRGIVDEGRIGTIEGMMEPL